MITLPLAGAAGLEPCAVEGAAEVAIVRKSVGMGRRGRLGLETSECHFVSFLNYEVIECWRGFAREKRFEEWWEGVDICCRVWMDLVSRREGIPW